MRESAALKQIGTIRVPARSQCAICGCAGVELAIEEEGKVNVYHWSCLEQMLQHIEEEKETGGNKHV